MKNLISALFILLGSAASFAQGAQKTKVLSQDFNSSRNLTDAVISTNISDLSQSKPNIHVDVMMNAKAAAALSYSTQSQTEARPRIKDNPKLTVDRTQFGIGADFYLKPLSAVYNAAVAPMLVFESEKDVLQTENNTGLGLRAVGLFKPHPRLMIQGGGVASVVNGRTDSRLLAGLGLMF